MKLGLDETSRVAGITQLSGREKTRTRRGTALERRSSANRNVPSVTKERADEKEPMGLDRWWSNSSAGVGAKCPRVLAGARVYTRVSLLAKRDDSIVIALSSRRRRRRGRRKRRRPPGRELRQVEIERRSFRRKAFLLAGLGRFRGMFFFFFYLDRV